MLGPCHEGIAVYRILLWLINMLRDNMSEFDLCTHLNIAFDA